MLPVPVRDRFSTPHEILGKIEVQEGLVTVPYMGPSSCIPGMWESSRSGVQ